MMTHAAILQSIKNRPCASTDNSGMTPCTSVRLPTSVVLAKAPTATAMKALNTIPASVAEDVALARTGRHRRQDDTRFCHGIARAELAEAVEDEEFAEFVALVHARLVWVVEFVDDGGISSWWVFRARRGRRGT